MCYIQVKNIRLNSFYEEKKIKLCLTKQLLNMFKLWCEWGISYLPISHETLQNYRRQAITHNKQRTDGGRDDEKAKLR